MKIAVFQTHKYDRPYIEAANLKYGFDLRFFETRLCPETIELVNECDVVCSFANDNINRMVVKTLKEKGIKLIATRSAGFNHIDIAAAEELGIPVVRVPDYSPHAVAEHAVALILALVRKIHHAYFRVRELNFTLDGLVGVDLFQKTVGIIGTGKIGSTFANIMHGFGTNVLAYDLKKNFALEREGKVTYVSLERLYKEADIISLHVPLTPQTHHLINDVTMKKMKENIILINTGRGALIDTRALISGLKSGKVGGAGLDVYEEETGIFFEDLSNTILKDDVLARLLTFPNVLVTSHQGFLTKEALTSIARVTLENINEFKSGLPLTNQVRLSSS